jgi:hypothetical protein
VGGGARKAGGGEYHGLQPGRTLSGERDTQNIEAPLPDSIDGEGALLGITEMQGVC